MRLRAAAEKELAQTDAIGGTSSASGFRPQGRSPSPLEYQSEHGEDDLDTTGTVDQVVPMGLDLPPPNPKSDVRRCPISIQFAADPIVFPRKVAHPLHGG
jgi:hypothetical protein